MYYKYHQGKPERNNEHPSIILIKNELNKAKTFFILGTLGKVFFSDEY